MEKIFRILVVFALLLLFVRRFIRGREPRYRPYDYITRLKAPLPAEMVQRMTAAVAGAPEGLEAGLVEGAIDAFLFEEVVGLLFCYSAVGRLTILRQSGKGRYRQMQELSVPLECTGISMDKKDGTLYFEAGGFLFEYGPV